MPNLLADWAGWPNSVMGYVLIRGIFVSFLAHILSLYLPSPRFSINSSFLQKHKIFKHFKVQGVDFSCIELGIQTHHASVVRGWIDRQMDGQIDVVATCGQKIKLMTLQRSQTQKCLLLTFFSLPPKSIYDKRILVLLLCTTTHLSDWSWHMLQYRQCTVLVLVNFQSGFL